MKILKYFLLSFAMLSPTLVKATDSPLTPEDQKNLRQIEEQIQEMKEDIFKSKSELKALNDTILRGKITGSKALVDFSNEVETLFILKEATFLLDGKEIFKFNASTDKKEVLKKVRLFDDMIPSGLHEIETKLVYRGSDKATFASFAYFKNQDFQVQSKNSFTVDYGKTSAIKIQALDKGYFKSNFNERLSVDFQVAQDWNASTPE